jgi:prenylcysteine oxidase/farnesylcysteine lyase
MYAGWNFVLSLIVAFLCGQSNGLWPFSIHAAAQAPRPEPVYPNSSAKRIAIIGMYL